MAKKLVPALRALEGGGSVRNFLRDVYRVSIIDSWTEQVEEDGEFEEEREMVNVWRLLMRSVHL